MLLTTGGYLIETREPSGRKSRIENRIGLTERFAYFFRHALDGVFQIRL